MAEASNSDLSSEQLVQASSSVKRALSSLSFSLALSSSLAI
jgi:hypothetical protein